MGGGEVAHWVEGATGQAVVSCVALVGGMSSEVSRFGLTDGSTLVVRHFADSEWLARHPHTIDQGYGALEVLARSDLPTPRMVAADGAVGLLAMSELPGVMHIETDFLADHVDAVAARIAAVDLPDGHGVPRRRSWVPPDPQPPEWGDRSLWAEALSTL
jgi:hypothetical protein